MQLLAKDGVSRPLAGRKWLLTRSTLQPIYCPGALQSYSVLIAFDVLRSGMFRVVFRGA